MTPRSMVGECVACLGLFLVWWAWVVLALCM